MKVAQIVNVTEQYHTLKNRIHRDKQELREYQLFDSHFGLNEERIRELQRSIMLNERNLKLLLDSNIKDVPMLDIMA